MPSNYESLIEVTLAVNASGDKPSRSPGYRHKLHKTAPKLTEASTLYEVFEKSVKENADKPCLGHRPKTKDGAAEYTFLTYKEVSEKVKAFAASVKAAGVKKPERLAVFGTNCPEWMMAMQACNRMSLECVPLYDTLGENAIEYIIDHSESTFVVVGAPKLAAFAAALPQIKQKLKGVVYWGKEVKSEDVKKLEGAGIKVTQFDKFVTDGASLPDALDPPKTQDLCTIMYTSGTTGDPKGVMLTHEAMVACVDGLKSFLKDSGLEMSSNDRTLSYLPLAHIFDRTCEEMFLSIGGTIGYWQGSLPDLVDDIAQIKPTIFIGVPRVFDRIYTKATDTVNGAGFVKKRMFQWGYGSKLNRLKAGFPAAKAAPFWDRLVFNKTKARLGGCCRAIVSGGAPLAPHVEEWMKVAMCCPVVQGYGLTETCAASFIAQPDNIKNAGTIGPPLPVTEFCLESVPDMKYDARADPPKGELLLRGPNNFQGYFKMQDKTDECLEKDGWFHTGDVAEVQPDGALKIIDRKKNIFKLAQGEYVAAEKLEGDYKKCNDVNQIWVYGNSFERSLVAVVVPKEESLTAWAKSKSISYSDFADLCSKKEARSFVLAALTEQAKLSKLRGFEYIKNVHLEPQEFGQENDLVTPTFKLKRPQLKERYNSILDDLYKEIADK